MLVSERVNKKLLNIYRANGLHSLKRTAQTTQTCEILGETTMYQLSTQLEWVQLSKQKISCRDSLLVSGAWHATPQKIKLKDRKLVLLKTTSFYILLSSCPPGFLLSDMRSLKLTAEAQAPEKVHYWKIDHLKMCI